MPPNILDPNRFASGIEAATVAARARVEQANVAVATERRDLAQESLRAAREQFLEVEAAYALSKATLDDATTYAALATQQLGASLEQLASARALLHPVRKTPLELLGVIFSYCLVELPTHAASLPVGEKDIRGRQRQPFQLAAVCRRWRQASLSYPAAWSTLELLLAGDRDTDHAWEAYISCILSRSSSTPLDIRIIRTRAEKHKDRKLIALIQPAISRCCTLLLEVESIRDGSDSLMPLITASLPLLRSVHLGVKLLNAFLQDTILLSDAPKLRFLYSNCSIRSSHPQALEVVVLDYPSIDGPSTDHDDLTGLFNMAPNVVDLTLMQRDAWQAIIRPEPITLASLVKLCVAHDESTGGTEFLRQCRLPRLDLLKLCGEIGGSSERINMLSAILPHSPILSTLILSMVAVDDVAPLCRALRLASALTNLTIRKSTFTHASLRLFADTLGRPGTNDGVWTCPALDTLTLDTCTFSTDCALDDIVQLVARRQRAAAAPAEEGKSRPVRLQTLGLPDDTDTAIISHVEALLDEE